MKVLLYARVSTDDKEQDPERQLMKCRQYASIKEYDVIAEVAEYYTGDSDPFTRPALSKAFNEYSFQAVLVFDLSRWSRQHPVKVIRGLQLAIDRGLKVVSVTEPAQGLEFIEDLYEHFKAFCEQESLSIEAKTWFSRKLQDTPEWNLESAKDHKDFFGNKTRSIRGLRFIGLPQTQHTSSETQQNPIDPAKPIVALSHNFEFYRAHKKGNAGSTGSVGSNIPQTIEYVGSENSAQNDALDNIDIDMTQSSPHLCRHRNDTSKGVCLLCEKENDLVKGGIDGE
jgi:hypothetical protein